MKQLLTNFKNSALEFTHLRSLVTAALLLALRVILSVFVSIQITESVRISISFICSVMIGALYGPVMGFVTGGLGDIIQFLIKPTGAFNPGLTLDACIAGLIYGLFFYGKFPKKIPAKDKTKPASKVKSIIFNCIACLLAVGALIPMLVKQPYALGGTYTAVAIIIIVGSALLIPLSFLPKTTFANIACVLSFTLSLLVFYTDRKTVHPGIEYVISLSLLGVYMLLSVWRIVVGSDMDVPFLLRCVITLFLDAMIVNVLLGTYWISMLIGTSFKILLVPRLIKNLIQLPINIILSYYVLYYIRKALPKK